MKKDEFGFINDILSDTFSIPKDKNNNYWLEEKKQKSQRIFINEKGIGYFKLYKFDATDDKAMPDPFPFLNSNGDALPKTPNGCRVFCDYFAICTYNGALCIILFELKTSEKDKAYAKFQLQKGECFAKFILDIAENIKSKNIPSETDKSNPTYKGSNYDFGMDYDFLNVKILKCTIISSEKNYEGNQTNPKKSKSTTKIKNDGNNFFTVIFNKMKGELVLTELL